MRAWAEVTEMKTEKSRNVEMGGESRGVTSIE
jgi:hypothetical protein